VPANTSRYSAIFLDRDGVINHETEYCHKIEDFKLIDGILDFLKFANKLSEHVFIVTNQAGIGRGFYTEDQYQILTDHMLSLFEKHEIKISRVYHCPHHPEGKGQYKQQCNCRKPRSGMIVQAIKDFDIVREQAILIGDKASDIAAAKHAGLAQAYLVETGHTITPEDKLTATGCFANLTELQCFLRIT